MWDKNKSLSRLKSLYIINNFKTASILLLAVFYLTTNMI